MEYSAYVELKKQKEKVESIRETITIKRRLGIERWLTNQSSRPLLLSEADSH